MITSIKNKTQQTTVGAYLSFLKSIVDVFVLLKLLQLCFDQNLSDVHHLLHGQSQALLRVAELLLDEMNALLLDKHLQLNKMAAKMILWYQHYVNEPEW